MYYSDKIIACDFKAFCRIENTNLQQNPIVACATVIQIDVIESANNHKLFFYISMVFSSFSGMKEINNLMLIA